MAGVHTGGSQTLAFSIDGVDAPMGSQHFLPKDDKAYAEGRHGSFLGVARTTNPFGLTHAAALLINQGDAWYCWDNGWNLYDLALAGWQGETSTVDGPGFT